MVDNVCRFKITIALLSFILVWSTKGIAQTQWDAANNALGITWNVPDNNRKAIKQLHFYSDLGFEYIQLNQRVQKQVWNAIDTLGYRVFGLLPVQFPVSETFAGNDSSFTQKLNNRLQYYISHPSVKAIGLFALGSVHDDEFRKMVRQFYTPLLQKINRPIYTIAKPSTAPLFTDSNYFKITYLNKPIADPNKSPKAYLLSLHHSPQINIGLIQAVLTSSSVSAPIFFKSNELKPLLKTYPTLKKSLKLYTSSQTDVIIFPEADKAIDGNESGIILTLLFIWLVLAITYYISPVFRESLFRYFWGHQFYVKDVIHRHIRSVLPGSSILIQHTLMAGIVAYCLVNSLFTALGKTALFYHYPILGVFGMGKFNFFLWGIVISLFLEILFIGWLRFISNKFSYTSQILNLYTWPLQLNILPATLIATLFVTGTVGWIFYMLCIIFVLLFFTPFIVTSMDIIHFSSANEFSWNIGLTIGLFSFIMAMMIIWIYLSPFLLDVIQLAASL